MKKRIVALFLLVACMGTLIGCGGETTTSQTGGEKTEWTITDEPTELTMFMVNGTGNLEDLEVWQEIARLTNVSLKTTNSKSISDVEQALNTLLASGNLPDLVMYGDSRAIGNKYGPEGAFAAIEELAAENNATTILEQFARPEVQAFATAPNGHIYYVPGINPETVAEGWFIRQDWLDKLGIAAPTTVEEYYNALVAIRDGDPNGNGEKDEVPYFSRFGRVDDLLTFWGAFMNWRADGDKVYFGPTREEFKTAYANVAKWYAEGLIDKEIYTRGGKSRDKLLGDNVGGSTHDWFGSTAQFNDMLAESVPGINFVAIAPPNGAEYYSRDAVITQGGMISEGSEKKDVAIKFMDFIYSPKGATFSNFGLEGKHYDMVDGKPTFRDWVIHGDKTAINILQESGAATAFPFIQDFWYEEQWMTPIAKAGAQLYLENDYLVEKFPTLSYTPEESTRFNQLMTAINTHVQETTQKWVFGNEKVEDTFDQFIDELYDMGLEEAEKIQQDAYDRYLAM